jgi:hypothetical protein
MGPMTDVDLADRISALERCTRRIIPAREGADGWANFVESRVAEESEFLREVVAHALAQVQREMIGACKTLIGEALAQRIRGTFDSKASYVANDVVACDGASFIARRNAPGGCPGPNWQMIARQGQRGVAGERGAPGRDAPRITGWIVDRGAFTVAPKFSDGTTGPLLELGALFSQDEEAA